MDCKYSAPEMKVVAVASQRHILSGSGGPTLTGSTHDEFTIIDGLDEIGWKE